jgi:hypothetical protein
MMLFPGPTDRKTAGEFLKNSALCQRTYLFAAGGGAASPP